MAAAVVAPTQSLDLSQSLSNEEGLAALEQLLVSDTAQVAVMPINWHTWGKQVAALSTAPFLSHVVAPNSRANQTKARPNHSTGEVKTASTKTAHIESTFSPTEIVIADIWRQVLGVRQLNAHDNFFDIGGNSLLAVEVISQIEAKTGARLQPASVHVQTLGQLAASVEATQPPIISNGTQLLPTDTNHNAHHQNRESPIYFGSYDEYLFGMYYQPAEGIVRDFGVVICPPWGQEYIRAHRAVHQLGLRLSNVGISVLRFDYYGTGDSAGDDLSSTIGQGLQDISMAMDELRARSGVKNIVLVGLRLGATMAALAGVSRQNVKGLVLWDPVVSGSDYLDELKEWHRKNLWYYLADIKPASVPHRLEVLGFALSETLLDELRQLDMRTLRQEMTDRILLVERQASEATGQLRAHLQNQNVKLQYQQIDGPQMWTENPDKALVPHQTLEAIIAWMTEE